MDELGKNYFDWMCSLVDLGWNSSHGKLLSCLHRIEFTYILRMDANRMQDGLDFRYRYGYEFGIPDREIDMELGIDRCSVLEMMVALAVRMEEGIMGLPDENRTGVWFWDMVSSLGLDDMDDASFNVGQCRDIVQCFLERRYSPRGNGGLFYIPYIKEDMRKVEIWCQAMWYLSEQ